MAALQEWWKWWRIGGHENWWQQNGFNTLKENRFQSNSSVKLSIIADSYTTISFAFERYRSYLSLVNWFDVVVNWHDLLTSFFLWIDMIFFLFTISLLESLLIIMHHILGLVIDENAFVALRWLVLFQPELLCHPISKREEKREWPNYSSTCEALFKIWHPDSWTIFLASGWERLYYICFNLYDSL